MSQLRVFPGHYSSDTLFAGALVHVLRRAGTDVRDDAHPFGVGHQLRRAQPPCGVTLVGRWPLHAEGRHWDG